MDACAGISRPGQPARGRMCGSKPFLKTPLPPLGSSLATLPTPRPPPPLKPRLIPEASRTARPEPWSVHCGEQAWRSAWGTEKGSKPVFFTRFLFLQLRDLGKRPAGQPAGRRLGAGLGRGSSAPRPGMRGRTAQCAWPRGGPIPATPVVFGVSTHPGGAPLFLQTF